MTGVAPFRLAVIADAHFHDIHGDYGVEGLGGLTLRPLAETARAQRLVNESHAALHHTLHDIAARGVRHVVLLGDYTDDGQAASTAGLRRLLAGFGARHRLRFHALPGNHDVWGLDGMHRSRRFMAPGGGHDLATSDPAARDPTARQVTLTPAMRGHGLADGLRALTGAGYAPHPDDLHHETPPPGPAALPDASRLVEPVPGVWLLLIDANVFLPGATAAEDAGWNALLAHKAHVLEWMADVAGRAARAGKRLLAFSHYPLLDPLNGTAADEGALLRDSAMARRLPAPAVAEAVLRAGITLHFSGHLHLHAATRHRGLTDIAVPSLVGYPAAYRIVTLMPGETGIETVRLDAMPLSPAVMACYRASGGAPHLTDHAIYGPFVDAHFAHMVNRRHLKRDWPLALVQAIRSNSLGALAGPGRPAADIPALTFVQDWYRLRMGGDLALADIPPARLADYRSLAAGPCADPALAGLLRIMDRWLARAPSARMTVT